MIRIQAIKERKPMSHLIVHNKRLQLNEEKFKLMVLKEVQRLYNNHLN